MRGFRTQLPYTSFCWNLLTISFGLNAYIAWVGRSIILQQEQASGSAAGILDKEDGNHVSLWLLRTALLTFETAAPAALMVAFVVRYGIWENALRLGQSTAHLKLARALISHNINVLMVCIEVALVGGIPVAFSHVAASALFGIAYVLFFSWPLAMFWKPEAGPQFLYFFLDTTLGETTTICLLVLAVIKMTFHAVFACAGYILLNFESSSLGSSLLFLFSKKEDESGDAVTDVSCSLLAHTCFVIGMCALVCRFRD